MNTKHCRRAGSLAALALLAGLAACGQREGGQTVGQQLDQALGRTRQAANDVRQGGREAANDARTSVMGAGGERKDTGPSESLGMKIDDAGITAKVKTGLAADKDLSAGKIEVDTREGVVTLKGDVANAAAKSRATEIARNVKNVKSVINDLTVKSG